MGVVEDWLVEGGGEELVLAVRGAVREDGGGVPGVVGLDDGLRGGEEGGARHFSLSFVSCLFRMAFAIGTCGLVWLMAFAGRQRLESRGTYLIVPQT